MLTQGSVFAESAARCERRPFAPTAQTPSPERADTAISEKPGGLGTIDQRHNSSVKLVTARPEMFVLYRQPTYVWVLLALGLASLAILMAYRRFRSGRGMNDENLGSQGPLEWLYDILSHLPW